MTDWRKTCDEIEAAAGKATPRPWRSLGDGMPRGGGALRWNNILGESQHGDGYAGPKVCEVTVDLRDGKRDPEYIVIAANNADRLARFSSELSKEAQLLWAKLYGVKIGIGGIQAFNEMVDRLWEESAK